MKLITFISLSIVMFCVMIGICSYIILRQATIDYVDDTRYILLDNMRTPAEAVINCKTYFALRDNLFPFEREEYDNTCLHIICSYDTTDQCMIYNTFIEKNKNMFGIKI